MSSLFRPQSIEGARLKHGGESLQVGSASHLAFTGFLAIVLLIAAGYLSVMRYAMIEPATGSLKSVQGVVRVAAPRPGVILSIAVTEGQPVVAGQTLFSLTSEESGRNGPGADAQIAEGLRAQQLSLQQQLAAAGQRAALESKELQARIDARTSEWRLLMRQRETQNARTDLAQSILNGLRDGVEKGYVSKANWHNHQEALLALQQNAAVLDQQLATKRGEMDQARSDLAEAPLAQRDAAGTLHRALDEVDQRLAEVEGRRFFEVRAPISGKATALLAAVGRNADPRLPLLSIIPADSEYQAELFVSARAIGFVHPGQRVRLMYDAFPFQRFGAQGGVIATVDETMTAPGELSDPSTLQSPAYRVIVTLDRQTIESAGRALTLRPDMTLKADIVLERRTLVAWLLAPAIGARNAA